MATCIAITQLHSTVCLHPKLDQKQPAAPGGDWVALPAYAKLLQKQWGATGVTQKHHSFLC